MAHLPAPIARVRGALRDFLSARRDAGELGQGDLLLAACSGGADSLALAAQLAFLAPRLGLRGGLVTVDHGMQPGSAHQADRVARLGERLGLSPVLILPADPGGRGAAGLGPEGAARQIRYAALEAAAEDAGARAVLLGHTMEDQAETVLLGLLRGAGTRAVAGMGGTRGRFWRPLLGVRRADTEGTCRELGLPVWQDPTNNPDGPWRTAAGEALPRAALRHHGLPTLGRALGLDPVPTLARTALLAREDSTYLESAAQEYFHLIEDLAADDLAADDLASDDLAGAVAGVDIEPLAQLPAALRWRVLRELLLRAGAPAGQLAMTHVHAVDALVTDWRGQRGASVPGGLRARRSCGRLYIVTPPHLENP